MEARSSILRSIPIAEGSWRLVTFAAAYATFYVSAVVATFWQPNGLYILIGIGGRKYTFSRIKTVCLHEEGRDGQFPPFVQPIRRQVSLNGPRIEHQFSTHTSRWL